MMNENKNVLIIGNFDGCHLGHKKLVDTAASLALKGGFNTAALTFYPNPKVLMGQLASGDQLLHAGQKERALRELGIDHVFLHPFSRAFMKMPALVFYEEIVKKMCLAAAVVVGTDFRFGYQREGSVATLSEFGSRDGIGVTAASTYAVAGEVVKSSLIRNLIKNKGDAAHAALLLGHLYAIEGRIVKGLQNGRKIGIPTANLGDVTQLLPKTGVYAGYVAWRERSEENNRFPLTRVDASSKPAVFNIGYRPSIAAGLQLTVEAHILSAGIQQDELYDKEAIYYFSHFIRDEMKFDSLDLLKTKIVEDILIAKKLLN
jgi:riboflavin kinase/FMN adenylyltransferase